jgi:hypothetical protein
VEVHNTGEFHVWRTDDLGETWQQAEVSLTLDEAREILSRFLRYRRPLAHCQAHSIARDAQDPREGVTAYELLWFLHGQIPVETIASRLEFRHAAEKLARVAQGAA